MLGRERDRKKRVSPPRSEADLKLGSARRSVSKRVPGLGGTAAPGPGVPHAWLSPLSTRLAYLVHAGEGAMLKL